MEDTTGYSSDFFVELGFSCNGSGHPWQGLTVSYLPNQNNWNFGITE